jgi:hypothetical protein
LNVNACGTILTTVLDRVKQKVTIYPIPLHTLKKQLVIQVILWLRQLFTIFSPRRPNSIPGKKM